jgi:valyl-tRNA synthetase
MVTLRDTSRKVWSSNDTLEAINAGSLQRIDDATEAMAKNHIALENQVKELEASRDYWRERYDLQERITRAQKGLVTKLRKQHPPSLQINR